MQHTSCSLRRWCWLVLYSLTLGYFQAFSDVNGEVVECPAQNGACGAVCRQRLCQALEQFYVATRGQLWYQSWNLSAVPCSLRNDTGVVPEYCGWEGVRCCCQGQDDCGDCKYPHSIVGIELPFRNLNGTVSGALASLRVVGACGLRVLDLSANLLRGAITDELVPFSDLEYLSLSQNRLGGLVAPWLQSPLLNLTYMSLSSNGLTGGLVPSQGMPRLRLLDLASNALTGTIPEGMMSLSLLEEVDLGTNSLSGPLPVTLCEGGKLTHLKLEDNMLTGSIAVLANCKALRLLNLDYNEFTGLLPGEEQPFAWTELEHISLKGNQLRGNLSSSLLSLSQLVTADLSYNRFSGSIPGKPLRQLRNLETLRLDYNNLTGPLPENLFQLPSLKHLTLSHNPNLTGTISKSIYRARSLTTLSVSHTGVSGSIPDTMQFLPHLLKVNLHASNMQGICQVHEFCKGNDLLPSFLHFSPRMTFPALRDSEDDSLEFIRNMECCQVERRPHGSREVLSLNGQNVTLSFSVDYSRQHWLIDPEYYLYETCKCQTDFKEHWELLQPGLRLVCVPDESWAVWIIILVIMGVICMLGILWLVGYLLSFKIKGLQPYLLRSFNQMKKRNRGPPVGVPVSVVVTDIEGYSDMIKCLPSSLMHEVMSIHNGHILKAKHDNCGYIIEQEGDSFTLAFYEAMDATMFCLQAQQLLQEADWPYPLAGYDESLAGRSNSETSAGLASVNSLGDLRLRRSRTASISLRPGSIYMRPAEPLKSSPSGRFPGLSSGETSPVSGSGHSHLQRCYSQSGSAFFSRTISGGLGSGIPAKCDFHPSFLVGPDNRKSMGTDDFMSGSQVDSYGQSSELVLTPLLQTLFSADPKLFRGVRVRMGVASGVLSEGVEVKHSATMQQAKLVVDMAQGGQVLLDGETFKGVKDRLYELGAVTSKGLDAKRLAGTNFLSVLMEKVLQRSSRPVRQVIVLDMGKYTLPQLPDPKEIIDHHVVKKQRRAQKKPRASSEFQHDTGGSGVHHDQSGLGTSARKSQESIRSNPQGGQGVTEETPARDAVPVSVTPKDNGGVSGVAKGHDSRAANPLSRHSLMGVTAMAINQLARLSILNRHSVPLGFCKPNIEEDLLSLYQMLPTSLACRGNLFGSDLSLKPSMKQRDIPYFDAPASKECSLVDTEGCTSDALLRDPLPQVTMVFCMVEGAKQISNRRLTPEVIHPLVATILKKTLQQLRVKGLAGSGYLCREQPGELKYMVAFASPQAAVEWCLLTQNALLASSWPEAVHDQLAMRPEFDPYTGARLFWGPRMKMGVCQGRPDYVCPDHQGRADYTGSTINQAARYMDAAAHGGQVACERVLIEEVVGLWAAQGALVKSQVVQKQESMAVKGMAGNQVLVSARSSMEQAMSLGHQVNRLVDAEVPTIAHVHRQGENPDPLDGLERPAQLKELSFEDYAHGQGPRGSEVLGDREGRCGGPASGSPCGGTKTARCQPLSTPARTDTSVGLQGEVVPDTVCVTISLDEENIPSEPRMSLYGSPLVSSATACGGDNAQGAPRAGVQEGKATVELQPVHLVEGLSNAPSAPQPQRLLSTRLQDDWTGLPALQLPASFSCPDLHHVAYHESATDVVEAQRPRSFSRQLMSTLDIVREGEEVHDAMASQKGGVHGGAGVSCFSKYASLVATEEDFGGAWREHGGFSSPGSQDVACQDITGFTPSTSREPSMTSTSALRRPSPNTVQNQYFQQHKLCIREVDIYHLGVFTFKGNPDPLAMVHVGLKDWAARQYPEEPPKGKGQRLEAGGGKIDGAHVALPGVEEWVQENYHSMNPVHTEHLSP